MPKLSDQIHRTEMETSELFTIELARDFQNLDKLKSSSAKFLNRIIYFAYDGSFYWDMAIFDSY